MILTFLYRIIYWLVRGLLPLLHGLDEKLSAGYQLRHRVDGVYPWLRFPAKTRPYWIHCASGEFEYALPLIRKLKQREPQCRILVSYFTPSYVETIQKEPLVDFVAPSPWDQPAILQEFIDHHEPVALLYARTDVWHEMARSCAKNNIPVLIFSMTCSQPLRGLKKTFAQWRWQFVDHFSVVSSADKKNLASTINEKKISVNGDTRFEQCLYRLAMNKSLPFSISTSKPLFIAGSTWPEDEDVLLPLMREHFKDCAWILVPHENTSSHVSSLRAKLEKFHLPFVFSSQTTSWNDDTILWVDQKGLLAELYKSASYAFVGGSFRKQVHSVMEALACGVPTFVGPYYHNNREAVDFSANTYGLSLLAVQVVKKTEELKKQFQELRTLWKTEDREKLKDLILDRANVSDSLYYEIKKRINS